MLTKNETDYLSEHLSFWNKLTEAEKNDVINSAFHTSYLKGKVFYSGDKECLGLILLEDGQFRSFISSGEGREISLYRLLSLDICILSASCMIKSINFDINIEVEKNSRAYIIPITCFNRINESNPAVKNFSLELISTRFSEVMWVFEQYVFGNGAQRLATLLLEQSRLEDSDVLNITHEFIANDIGTAREVITRLLKHFTTDGIVSLSRGTIKIKDFDKLKKLCGSPRFHRDIF